MGYVGGCVVVLVFGIYGWIFTLALRVSARSRVTLLLQPKRVTRKGRRYSIAPAGFLKLGVLPTSPP